MVLPHGLEPLKQRPLHPLLHDRLLIERSDELTQPGEHGLDVSPQTVIGLLDTGH